jgi:hypothetical protein
MMNLKLNIFDLAKSIIPYKIRGFTHDAWLKSCVKPLSDINGSCSIYAQKVRYDLSFNGQVMYLERVLNDTFDQAQRRIYIDDPTPNDIDNLYVYYKLEDQPSPFVYYEIEGNLQPYLLYEAELYNNPDFIVWIPISLFTSFNEPKIRSLIKKYKQAGKFYTINTF